MSREARGEREALASQQPAPSCLLTHSLPPGPEAKACRTPSGFLHLLILSPCQPWPGSGVAPDHEGTPR